MKKIFNKLDTFGYLISSAFSRIIKNGLLTFASIAVLVVCLLVTGSFYLIIRNINTNIGDLEYLNKLVAYIDDKCDADQSVNIYNEIKNVDGVKDALLITKEEALEDEMVKHPEYFEALEEGDNPYRDSVVITYQNGSDVAAIEKKISDIENVDIVKSRAELADTVDSLKNALTYLSVGFFVSLFVVTVFIIITTVKVSLYARKDEVSLMYTIGATKSFITLPFILEGMIIGLTASVIAYFIQWWIYSSLTALAVKYASLIQTLTFSQVSPVIMIGFAGVGLITGILGSTISLGKYMKKE